MHPAWIAGIWWCASLLFTDDFQRERNADQPEASAAKDALEGKAPPELRAVRWRNVPDPEKGLTWKDLEGKVVLVDFWGVW